MKEYKLTFHEIMDTDFTAITLECEDGTHWSNFDDPDVYDNQSKKIYMSEKELEFTIKLLDLRLL